MNDREETYTHAGLVIEIIRDTDSGNPFTEFDQLGTLICEPATGYGRRDNYSNKHAPSRDEIPAIIATPGTVYLTVSHHDYSHEMTTSADPYDEDRSDGIIYCTREQWREAFMHPSNARLTAKRRARIQETLAGEIETYSQWRTGNVYGYVISTADEDGAPAEELDALWGMYGLDYCKTEANATAEDLAKQRAAAVIERANVYALAADQFDAAPII